MSLHEEKTALRHEAALKLQELDAAYLEASDDAIFHTVLAQPEIHAAHTVFCYVSVGKEPATGRLIETLLAMGKRVAVPRCQGQGIMDACPLASFSELLPAPFGLLEPGKEADVVAPGELDVVIAPCVAADRQGGRLGHGAGYYDRFLAKTHCPVFCLCRGRLLYNKVPTEPFDVKVGQVVTEEGIFPKQDVD